MKVVMATMVASAALGAAALPMSSAAQQPANAARGKTLFQQRCAACHSVAPNGRSVGPNLVGVVGRKAAAAQFNYSPAMKKSGLVWDSATLDKYLATPTKTVPGTRMVIGTPAAPDRAAIIAYLNGVR